jgi:hypothetical protein
MPSQPPRAENMEEQEMNRWNMARVGELRASAHAQTLNLGRASYCPLCIIATLVMHSANSSYSESGWNISYQYTFLTTLKLILQGKKFPFY